MKRALSRCLSFLLTLLLFCTSVIGCGLQQSDPSPSPSADTIQTAVSTYSVQRTDLALSTAKAKEINIIFMGNSLTQTGNMPLHFTYLDEDRNIRVTEMSRGGQMWHHHVDRLNSSFQEDAFDHIDIVALQYYLLGKFYPDDQLKILFGADKEYYGFSGIPFFLLEQELSMAGFEYDTLDFYLPDKVHPTSLCGYTMALTLYCTIFDVNPTEQNNGCLTAYDIPGDTQQEDEAYMAALKKGVQRMVDTR